MNAVPGLSTQDSINAYLNFIRQLCPLITQEELDKHADRLSVVALKKKDFFIEAGERQKNVGFVTTGLIRSFYIDKEEKEVTQQFVADGNFASHYAALLSQQPSRYYYQCLEDTVLVKIPYESIVEAYEYSHQFERFGRLIAEHICQAHHLRIESFLFETAEQRYLSFVTDYSNLFNRVSITQLCSYLGVERQTLTRIRSKLAKS